MRLSTRNQLKGTVASVEVGAVMTIVKVELDGGQHVTRPSPATVRKNSTCRWASRWSPW